MTGEPGAHAVAIVGEPGIGKSAVWSAACERFEHDRVRVLRSRVTEAESELSYCAVSDLIAPLVEERGAAMPVPLREAIEVAMLRRSPGEDGIHIRAVAEATLWLLEHEAAEEQVVIAIDDVQWLDRASSVVLGFALRRLRAASAGVLVTTRGRDVSLLEALDREGLLADLVIGPLSREAVCSMLAAEETTRVPPRVATAIFTASGGNPLLAKELARAHRRGGRQRGSMAESTATGRVLALMGDRIGDLSPRGRDVALLAAAAARPSVALIEAVLGAEVAGRDVAEAAASGVLEHTADGGLRFGHPLLAEATTRLASAEERRLAHERLAHHATSSEDRAWHLGMAQAEPDVEVAGTVAAAAREAAARGALAAAADLADLSLKLTPVTADAARCSALLLLGERLFDVGESERAERAAREVIDAKLHGPVRAWARLLLGRICYQALRSDEAVQPLQGALDDAVGDRRLTGEIHITLGWLNVLPSSRRVEHADMAVDLFSAPGDSRWLARALVVQANARRDAGEPVSLRPLRRARALVGTRVGADAYDVEVEIALLLMATDRLNAARPRFEAILSDAERREEYSVIPELHMLFARLEWLAGRWAAAEQHARACQSASVQAGLRFALGHVELLYPLAASDPEGSECAALIPVVERLAARGGDAPNALTANAALGLLALTVGEWDGAADRFDAAAELADRYEYRSPVDRFEASHVEALVAAGRPGDARGRLARLEYQAVHGRSRWAAAVLPRCLGGVLAAEGSSDAARLELATAVARAERLGMPFEHARSLLAHGDAERRAKQKRAARTALVAAREEFAAIGALPWAARAQASLDRVGGRSAVTDELTAGEERVALLAAAGRTNAEIARELFISVHTVESNLTRVYRKLGIHRRSQLGFIPALSKRGVSKMP